MTCSSGASPLSTTRMFLQPIDGAVGGAAADLHDRARHHQLTQIWGLPGVDVASVGHDTRRCLATKACCEVVQAGWLLRRMVSADTLFS